MSDAKKFYTSIPLSQEERLRRKAESGDPIPVRLTNNYAFHRVFKKPEVCKGFLMALLHLTEEEIQSLEVSDPFQEGEEPYGKEGILDIKIHLLCLNIKIRSIYTELLRKLRFGRKDSA